MESAYSRGRQQALAELEQFCVDAAARARKMAYESRTSLLPSERTNSYEHGILVGIACAHERLLEVIQSGQIPKLENLLAAENKV